MLPIFDEAEALKYVDGDRTLLVALVGAYAEQKPIDLENLHTGLANRDVTLFHRSAHNLKSSTRTLGGQEAFTLAFALETRARALKEKQPNASWDGLDQQVVELLAALERLQLHLDRLVV